MPPMPLRRTSAGATRSAATSCSRTSCVRTSDRRDVDLPGDVLDGDLEPIHGRRPVARVTGERVEVEDVE